MLDQLPADPVADGDDGHASSASSNHGSKSLDVPNIPAPGPLLNCFARPPGPPLPPDIAIDLRLLLTRSFPDRGFVMGDGLRGDVELLLGSANANATDLQLLADLAGTSARPAFAEDTLFDAVLHLGALILRDRDLLTEMRPLIMAEPEIGRIGDSLVAGLRNASIELEDRSPQSPAQLVAAYRIAKQLNLTFLVEAGEIPPEALSTWSDPAPMPGRSAPAGDASDDGDHAASAPTHSNAHSLSEVASSHASDESGDVAARVDESDDSERAINADEALFGVTCLADDLATALGAGVIRQLFMLAPPEDCAGRSGAPPGS